MENKNKNFVWCLIASSGLLTHMAIADPIQEVALNKNEKTYLTTNEHPSESNLTAQTKARQTLGINDLTTPTNKLSFNFSILTQAQSGRLDWNIAADITGQRAPNTLSELTYDGLDVQSLYTRLESYYHISNKLRLQIALGISDGTISSGTVMDADYGGNNKTQVRSLSQSNPAGSGTSLRNVSLGIERSLRAGTQLGVLIGFESQKQQLIKRNGLQLLSLHSQIPAEGSVLSNLNSSYDTQWNSHFLGFKLSQTLGKHAVVLGLNYHQANYYAQADWNLRSSFEHPKSFEHIATGGGLSARIDYHIPIYNHWHLTLSANREQWQTRDGLDRVFLKNGTTPITRLNESNWNSLGYGLGLTYSKGF